MERMFNADLEASHELALDEWRRRSPLARFKEWLARRMEYML
jgi:hypothetical protein